jgi:hypothetical protein
MAAAMLKKVANCTARTVLLAGAPRRSVQPHIANPRHCGRFCSVDAETVRCPNTLLTKFAAKIQQIEGAAGARRPRPEVWGVRASLHVMAVI